MAKDTITMPVPFQPILRFDEEVSELVSGKLRQ